MKLKTKVLYLVSFAAFLRSFAQVIYVPSLATMRGDLNTTTAMIGLTLSIYGLCLAFAQIAYGPIVDRFEGKRILLIGLVLYLFGNLGAYFSQGIGLLLVARSLQALGIAAAAGVGIALITDLFPVNERGRAMGIFSMFNSAGAASGPAFGGLIAVWLSWRADFIVLAIITIGLLVFTIWQLPAQPVHGQNVGLKDMLTIARALPTFGALVLGFVHFYGLYTIHTLTPILLADKMSLHEAGIGAVTTMTAIGVIVGTYVGGRASDQRGLRFTLMVGVVGATITFLALTFISAITSSSMSPVVVALALLAFGLTAGYGFAAQLNIMVDYFPAMRGTAGALQFFARFVGTTIAPLLAGYLADRLGLPSGYGLATALLALGAVIAYFTVSNPVLISEAIAK
ncbi:MAG: MFS transporter [Anaerolineaceae bacterium]|nr:MAG: MFS transporter [Anaerolineaceae bacterium]